MADGSQRDLPYGHFGVARYDTDDSTWRFERILSTATFIKTLGEPRTIPNYVRPTHSRDQAKAESLGRRHRTQQKALASSHPGLPPVADVLLPILRVSDAVQNAVRWFDPTRSSLLEYSRVRSNVLHRSFPVVAMAANEDCSVLRIAQVQTRRQGWDGDKTRWLEVPAIRGEETTWNVGDGPILQICCAQPIERGDHFMAVRYYTKTRIFRPSHNNMSEDEGQSTIAPGFLYSIDVAFGCPSHIDVSFNPWFPQQVGVVDQGCAWTVMEFQSSKMARVARTWTGQTHKDGRPAFATDDGWSRIAWVCDQETVSICTRQSIRFFSLAADVPILVNTIDVSRNGSATWILDFLVLPQHPDHLVVLTSSHIVIYEVKRQVFQSLRTITKAKFRHFKPPEDLSMCLRAWPDEQGVSLLLLSNGKQLAEIYRLKLDGTIRCFRGDTLGPLFLTQQNPVPILDLRLHALSLVSKGRSSTLQPTQVLLHQQFLLCTALLPDGSVTETVLYSSDPQDRQSKNDLPEPIWEAQRGVLNPKLVRERFIVDDAAAGSQIIHLPHPEARRARRVPQLGCYIDRTVNLEMTTDTLQNARREPQLVEEVLEMAKSALSSTDANVLLPSHTLHSVARDELAVQDMHQISDLLDEMAFGRAGNPNPRDSPDRLSENQRYFKFTTISAPRVCGLDNELTGGSLATAYNYLLASWVGGLSDAVPGRIKLAKVATARHVATEVVLATRLLQVEDILEDEETYAPPIVSQTSDFTWNIPVRASRSQQLLSSPDAGHSIHHSSLPTPSPTATPSVATASNHSAVVAAPELYRLSKYASFSRPTPMVQPRSLKKVLSHWTTGTDPANYDWLSTSKKVDQLEEDEVDVEMTEKERKAIQRRAERHIKRQRKEAAASQAQHSASNLAPEIFSASQPVAKVESQPPAHVGSSQSYSTGAAVASQVLPGRFGGRPPPKKKRKSGF